MSKLPVNTADKILVKALEMFNKRGIEYVGLRELAAILGMRVSNITYYFPTKDDLVNQLSLELNQLNSEIIVQNEQLTMKLFLEMLNKIFINHATYRCLFISFVHLMEQNKVIAARYERTQKLRNETLKSNTTVLINSGYLKVKEESDIEFLVSAIALISRFWISEAAVSFKHLDIPAQINHYLSMIAKMLLPYATAKGKKDIRIFLEAL